MKLARELSKRQTGRTLYLLDEPTTGLHFDDVRKLLEVLHRLVDLGNSVIIIEHNLDVIRNADWILDLGPEGGEDGGRVVGEGRPAKIAATPGSYTGQFLTRYYASTNGKLTPVNLDADIETADSATKVGTPSLPLLSAERMGVQKAEPAKPKRTRRNTPAEDDLAATRAKAVTKADAPGLGTETWDSTTPSGISSPKTTSKPSGPRKKKTGLA
jgi:excinuclease ABC subunit A